LGITTYLLAIVKICQGAILIKTGPLFNAFIAVLSNSCGDSYVASVRGGRLTSRVLEPPGGRSSLCLGGGSFADSRPAPSTRNKENAYPAPHSYNRLTKGEQYEPALSSAPVHPKKKPELVRRDSLDEMIDESSSRRARYIPGLENHPAGKLDSASGRPPLRDERNERQQASIQARAYQKSDQDSGAIGSGRNSGRSAMSPQDYAAALREQINTKLKIKQQEEQENDPYERQSREKAPYSRQSGYGVAGASSSRATSGQRYGNQSTNFLNWEES
jgi:hypothetical protein